MSGFESLARRARLTHMVHGQILTPRRRVSDEAPSGTATGTPGQAAHRGRARGAPTIAITGAGRGTIHRRTEALLTAVTQTPAGAVTTAAAQALASGATTKTGALTGGQTSRSTPAGGAVERSALLLFLFPLPFL